ncbi:MAG: TIGR04283 family arsenosugar biosynthesis glycosyltransferase, partial [Cyanobacteria bacterium J06555_12]
GGKEQHMMARHSSSTSTDLSRPDASGLGETEMQPSIAIVIPTYQEESALGSCLDSLQGQTPPFDVIVTDGGSSDRTLDIANNYQLWDAAGGLAPVQVVRAPERGRAQQMNAGAQQARADVLLFLHADSQLPEAGLKAVRRAMLGTPALGGRFAVSLDRHKLPYTAIEWGMNARTRLTGCFTGDMGIFVWRSLFEQLGGYPQQPLMEDYEFSRRMQQRGQVAYLPQKIVTSSRRWQQHGPLKTVALMQAIRMGYRCGVSAERLASWYRVVR